jgi:hypothetical protein
MRLKILIPGSLFLALALGCGSNGANTAPDGLSSCDQLRACTCTEERTSNVEGCNTSIDNYESQSNGESTCRSLLTAGFSGCGQPLSVDN